MNADPQHEASLTIQDFSGLFSKYGGWIVAATLTGGILFTAAAFKLPKKYKAHFVLTIYSKYFQSPLIGDFVPELSESSEMRSQRESLIRQILTPEYLDSLGNKYGIYASEESQAAPATITGVLLSDFHAWCLEHGLVQPRSSESRLSLKREDLLSRIEIFSLNNTTFNVGFNYSDPGMTLRVTQDIYGQVIQSLLEVRMHTLVNVRDAIRKQFGSLQAAIAAAPPASSLYAAPAPRPLTDGEELKQVRNQLSILTAQYTDEHPVIQQLRERERILESRMQNAAGPEVSGEPKPPAAGSDAAVRDIYSDLMKKFNYLNIAIDSDKEHQSDYFATLETPLYPSAPLWPKKGLFAIWGLAFGFFGSFVIAALKEYFDRSALHAGALAQQLGLPLLGDLPVLPRKASPPQENTPGRR